MLQARLLDESFRSAQGRLLEELDSAVCLNISCDSSKDKVANESVTNIVVQSERKQPMLLNFIYSGGERHDADYYVRELTNAISEPKVRAERVVAIVTDHAKSNVVAWAELERRFPWILCIGCLAHGLNLQIGRAHV